MGARRGGAHLLIGRALARGRNSALRLLLSASRQPAAWPSRSHAPARRRAAGRGLEALRTRGPPGSAGHGRGRRAEDRSGGALRRARPLGTLPSAPGWPPPRSLPQSGSGTPGRCAGQAGGQCALPLRAAPSPLGPKPGPPKLSAPPRPSTSAGRSGARLPGAALRTLQFPGGTGAGRSPLASARATPTASEEKEGGRARAGGGGGRVWRWRREGRSFLLLLPAAGPARPQQLETCAEKGTPEVLQSEACGHGVTTGQRK